MWSKMSWRCDRNGNERIVEYQSCVDKDLGWIHGTIVWFNHKKSKDQDNHEC